MSEDDSTFVRITNRDIWDKLIELEKEFEELKPLLVAIPENKKRIRSLELRFYGILAGLVGAATLFFANLAQGGKP